MKQFLNKKNPDHHEILLKNFDNIDNIKIGIIKIIPSFYKVFDWNNLTLPYLMQLKLKKCNVYNINFNHYCYKMTNIIHDILVSNKTKDIGILRVLGVRDFNFLRFL